MTRRIHMQDQVGANKIEEIMRHDYGQCVMEQWALKFALIGMFLLLGVSW
jgi:hypothetical protein